MNYLCPHCGQAYTNEDLKEFNVEKIYYILLKHGIPSRVISELTGLSHQGIRYKAEKYAEIIGEEL